MSKKKLILSIIAVILVIGIAAGVYFVTRPQPTAVQKDDSTKDFSSTSVEDQKSFTVTVVHKDGSTKDFSYTSNEEYLGTVLQAEGLVTGTMGQYGLYIDAVDGETASYNADGAYWSFYIGDAYAQTGIDLTPIEDGAAYKLVYEVYAG